VASSHVALCLARYWKGIGMLASTSPRIADHIMLAVLLPLGGLNLQENQMGGSGRVVPWLDFSHKLVKICIILFLTF
jgi:hypothetical protein